MVWLLVKTKMVMRSDASADTDADGDAAVAAANFCSRC